MLLQFIKQKYVITLNIKEENILNLQNMYESTNVVQVVESLGNFSPSQEQNLDTQQMSVTKVKLSIGKIEYYI